MAVGTGVSGGTGVSAGAMVGGRVGLGFVDGGGLAGVAVAVCGGAVGTSDVGSSSAAGVALAVGNGVGVASWALPFVGSTSGCAAAVGIADGMAVDRGSPAPPQAAKSPALAAIDEVTRMVFRNLMLFGKVELTKNLTWQRH